MGFTGLHPDAPAFYAELADHNTKQWWEANHARYVEHVRAPFEALAAELEPEFGDVKIFRPHRDVRFGADKSPYKLHIGMVSRTPVAHYLQLSADGLLVGGGAYAVPTPALARFRQLVADDATGAAVESILAEVAAEGFAPMAEDSLRTAPRGYPADHPRIALLRLKHLAIGRHEDLADWMWTPDAFDILSDQWRTVSRWTQWLDAKVGHLLER